MTENSHSIFSNTTSTSSSSNNNNNMNNNMNGPTIAAIPPQAASSTTSVVTNNNNNSNSNNTVPDTSNDAALAAALAAQELEQQQHQDLNNNNNPLTTVPAASLQSSSLQNTTTNNTNNNNNMNYNVAHSSLPWQYDDLNPNCFNCNENFNTFNRKHHCRLCGNIFCNNCSKQKALIPPSRIVLHPTGGKKVKSNENTTNVSFTPDPDPDRMLTYVATTNNNNNNTDSNNSNNNNNEQLLYGKGLEERFQLAREPIRVCTNCYNILQPIQEELRNHNSHAMRFNYIDPTDIKRLFNSPIAFTLGHEIRKASYTLNNLLPQPKRRHGALIINDDNDNPYNTNETNINYKNEIQQCQETCSTISPNLGDVDGVRIPAVLLERAKGIAVMTVIKGGFGLAGFEFGTGLVVARINDNGVGQQRWSAPSAIGTAGISWGALLGAQISDHVFLLMTDKAVNMLFNKSSVQLGADIGVAIGPLGRTVEGDWGIDGKDSAPIYTYSLSKGLYAGISLDGKIIITRDNVNEKFYGYNNISSNDILYGNIPTPPAAQPLYEALHRCHVYATNTTNTNNKQQQVEESNALLNEYGESLVQQQQRNNNNNLDQPSIAGMSDITTDF